MRSRGLVPQPLGQYARGSAGVGVNLRFTPEFDFDKTEAMENIST